MLKRKKCVRKKIVLSDLVCFERKTWSCPSAYSTDEFLRWTTPFCRK